MSVVEGFGVWNFDEWDCIPFMLNGERNPALEWWEICSVHQSKMQQTICEAYDLRCRRIGKNPFSGGKHVPVWVAVGVKETRVNVTPCPECGGADAEGCCTWVTSE